MKPNKQPIRLGRRLIQPRAVGRLLFGMACAVTLIALFYLVENWRGGRAWAKCRAELEARGIPLEWEHFIPPPVPDADNFATTPFLAPLFDFKPGTREWRDTNAYQRIADFAARFEFDTGLGDWQAGKISDLGLWLADSEYRANRRPSDPPRFDARGQPSVSEPGAAAKGVLAALEPVERILEELRAASRLPDSRFPLDYQLDDLYAILVPNLAPIRAAARALELRALARLELGQTEAALTDLLLVWDLGDAVRSEPILISCLVRAAVWQMGTQILWEGMVRKAWSAEQCERIQDRAARAGFLPETRRAILAEHVAGQRTIERMKRNPKVLEQLGFGDLHRPPLEALAWRLAPDGWFDFEHVNLARGFFGIPPRVFDEENIGRRAVEGYGKWQADSMENASVLNHRALSAVLLPSLVRVKERAARAETAVRLVRTACALERFRQTRGEFPEALTELIPEFFPAVPEDPMTGDPLRYRREPTGGFTLYSVGWNSVDDGGVIALDDRGRLKVDDGDWVWAYPDRNDDERP